MQEEKLYYTCMNIAVTIQNLFFLLTRGKKKTLPDNWPQKWA